MPGDELEYVLSYTNNTATTATGITIIDNDPNFESVFLYATLTDSGLGAFVDSDFDGLYDIATFGPFDVPAFQTQEVRFRVRILDAAGLMAAGNSYNYTLRNAYGNDVTVVTLPNLSYNKTVEVDGADPTQNE